MNSNARLVITPICRMWRVSEDKASLYSSEKGAMLLTALFMMTFLVALLYMLLGIAETLRHQEAMQDAADASALAAAVLQARGMNLLALLNILMALLVSVLVAIRLAQTFFAIASSVLYGLAIFWGATSPAAAACQAAAVQLGNVYRQAKDPIFNVIEGLHSVQEATSVVVPWMAMGSALYEAAKHHPPAKGAFALPNAVRLPVEVDDFPVLCGHATDMAITGSLRFVSNALPVPKKFLDIALAPIEEGAQAMGTQLSGYLCGDGTGQVPEYQYDVETVYPRPPGLDSCQTDPQGSRCQAAQQKLTSDGDFDERTGKCLRRCSYDAPYESQARRARQQCDPRELVPAPHSYTWQSVTVDGTFVFQNGEWIEESHRILESRVEETRRPPCDDFPDVEKDKLWNRDSGDSSRDEPIFLCKQEPNIRRLKPHTGQTAHVTYRAALRILACSVKESRSIQMAEEGDAFGGEGSEKRSPYRTNKDVKLGDEAFQIRTLAFGDRNLSEAEEGVLVSLHGLRENRGTSQALGVSELLERFSVAQSEFYFDHDGSTPDADFLWELRWRARLVRFRMPTKEERDEEEQRQQKEQGVVNNAVGQFGGNPAVPSLGAACQSAGSNACPAENTLDQFSRLVLH